MSFTDFSPKQRSESFQYNVFISYATLLVFLLTLATPLLAAKDKAATNARGIEDGSGKKKKKKDKPDALPRGPENRDEAYYASLWQRWESKDNKQRQEVFKTLQAIVKQNPGEGLANYYLGIMAAEKGDTKAAQTYYEAALPSYPESADLKLRLAALLFEQGEHVTARPYFEGVLELEPANAEALAHMGGYLLDDGKTEEALPMFQTALQADPEHPLARRGVGMALATLGRHSEALEPLKASVENDPKDVEAIFMLAKVYQALGRSTEAAECFALAKKLGRRDEETVAAVGYDLARSLAQAGNIDAAVKEYLKCIKNATDPAAGMMELAQLYVDNRRDKEAAGMYRKAAAYNPKLTEAVYRLGKLYRDTDQIEVAIQEYESIAKRKDEWGQRAKEELVDLKKEHDEAVVDATKAQLKSSDEGEREQAIYAILEKDKKNEKALRALLELEETRGNAGAACDAAKKLKQYGYISKMQYERIWSKYSNSDAGAANAKYSADGEGEVTNKWSNRKDRFIRDGEYGKAAAEAYQLEAFYKAKYDKLKDKNPSGAAEKAERTRLMKMYKNLAADARAEVKELKAKAKASR